MSPFQAPVVEDATVKIGGQTLTNLQTSAGKAGTLVTDGETFVRAPSFVDSKVFPKWDGIAVNAERGSPAFVPR